MEFGFGAFSAGPFDSRPAPAAAKPSCLSASLMGAGCSITAPGLRLAAVVWAARKVKEKLDSGERLTRRWLFWPLVALFAVTALGSLARGDELPPPQDPRLSGEFLAQFKHASGEDQATMAELRARLALMSRDLEGARADAAAAKAAQAKAATCSPSEPPPPGSQP